MGQGWCGKLDWPHRGWAGQAEWRERQEIGADAGRGALYSGSSQPASVLGEQRAGAPSWTGPRWWRWRSHTPRTSAAGSAEQFGTGGDEGTAPFAVCRQWTCSFQLACCLLPCCFLPMLLPAHAVSMHAGSHACLVHVVALKVVVGARPPEELLLRGNPLVLALQLADLVGALLHALAQPVQPGRGGAYKCAQVA